MIKERVYPLLVLLLFAFSIWYVFYDRAPQYSTDYNSKVEYFSTDRAFEHVKAISEEQHYVGTIAHSKARNYIVDALESLGLEVQTQQDFCINKYGEYTIPENIISKIDGEDPEAKTLLLMSHYDSEPHSSYGASDAASGVAAILEATRAFLASGITPKHDIIICFTDAEELGLLGAQLFVEDHPWAKNVGLVLNFESRGSGGPSNMIVETNHGNAKMIEAFSEANTTNPLGTSLMYSVYKMLPNDTDSTVFREDGDIPSFFFAFIDDHYDYHTALDTPDRLDMQSLAHQGDYAYNLIMHFSQTPLDDKLMSEEDMIYFNFPELGMLYYPFSWRWIIFALSVGLFFIVLYKGFQKQVFVRKEISLGFLSFLIALILSFVVGFLGWKVVLWAYPDYSEILQGFPYNGHDYLFAFVCICLSINFLTSRILHEKLNAHNALVAPLSFWMLLCGVISYYLPGGSYFSIVFLFGVLSLAYSAFRIVPNFFVIWLLSFPLIGFVIPLIQTFPVGLGMGMVSISTVFTSLSFGLLLGFIGYLPFKRFLAVVFLCLGLAFIINAHVNSDFSKENPYPNSLIYIQDTDSEEAFYGSYDNGLDDWNRAFFTESISAEKIAFQSKYSTALKHTAKAPLLDLNPSRYSIGIDSLENGMAQVKISIRPNANTERIELYAPKEFNFESFQVNGKAADTLYTKNDFYHVFYKRYDDRLLTYHVVNREELILDFKAKLPLPDFEVFDMRFNLLENKDLGIPNRTRNMIPKPFVVNDAIILKKRIKF